MRFLDVRVFLFLRLKGGKLVYFGLGYQDGLVFLPGMMTGQILAGADPEEAVRYQIVVMFMLVASTALSSIIVLLMVRCFSPAMSFVLRK